jgi:hypothetical protein
MQPIFFNYCGSIAGSRIAKNSIRDSNQRCIVLAGTDNASVEENIAYNTAGHCFVLQDGTETGNHFVRNLGVKTKTVATVIPGDESDGYPSTFFSASADNIWEENVAAGSEADGFSIELQSSVKGLHADEYSSINPAALPLTLFKNNVAHSNQRVSRHDMYHLLCDLYEFSLSFAFDFLEWCPAQSASILQRAGGKFN